MWIQLTWQAGVADRLNNRPKALEFEFELTEEERLYLKLLEEQYKQRYPRHRGFPRLDYYLGGWEHLVWALEAAKPPLYNEYAGYHLGNRDGLEDYFLGRAPQSLVEKVRPLLDRLDQRFRLTTDETEHSFYGRSRRYGEKPRERWWWYRLPREWDPWGLGPNALGPLEWNLRGEH